MGGGGGGGAAAGGGGGAPGDSKSWVSVCWVWFVLYLFNTTSYLFSEFSSHFILVGVLVIAFSRLGYN